MPTPSEHHAGLPLDSVLGSLKTLHVVYKSDIRPGDFLEVRTRNSRYTIRVLGENLFLVSGGWFDRQGCGPMEISISGCTWGGSTIKVDIVAACGLCIEFGNRVTTSAIQRIVHLPREIGN